MLMGEHGDEVNPKHSEESNSEKFGRGKIGGISVQALYDVYDVSKLQEIGDQFGIDVSVLKKEGETYIHSYVDKKGDQATHTGSVPGGKSYISIVKKDGAKDLSDFWKAVNEEKASRSNPSNPSKKI